ncbi:unnamed protein product [Lathyrus oleraceus]
MAQTIDDLIEQPKVGLFTSQDRHDILVEAIGTEEHPGRVSGLGRGVGFKVFFGPSKSFSGKTRKREIKEVVVIELEKERKKQDMKLEEDRNKFEEERKRWREEQDRKFEEDRKKFEEENKRCRKEHD